MQYSGTLRLDTVADPTGQYICNGLVCLSLGVILTVINVTRQSSSTLLGVALCVTPQALAVLTVTSNPDCESGQPKEEECLRLQKQVRRNLSATQEIAPRHPGVYHYILHAYDSPDCKSSNIHTGGLPWNTTLPPVAMQAAAIYPELVSSACHALHMPAHIYLRVGDWNMSRRSNAASLRAADEYARSRSLPLVTTDADNLYHSLEYLENDFLQLGRYKDAKCALDRMSDAILLVLGTSLGPEIPASEESWRTNGKYLWWGYRMRSRMEERS